ncbi:Hypothetical_protein [Hexamita inflata]|uniref:Hypothetical_protein n=1 Tax=Hexamita inflata TaxID=28002 RepID=A0AA86RDF0_9EUKA|nr:Hypothetical protein HINF_LOCUS63546 [Hexamita inflata]
MRLEDKQKTTQQNSTKQVPTQQYTNTKIQNIFKEYVVQEASNEKQYKIETLQQKAKDEQYNQFKANYDITGAKSDYDFNLYTIKYEKPDDIENLINLQGK